MTDRARIQIDIDGAGCIHFVGHEVIAAAAVEGVVAAAAVERVAAAAAADALGAVCADQEVAGGTASEGIDGRIVARRHCVIANEQHGTVGEDDVLAGNLEEIVRLAGPGDDQVNRLQRRTAGRIELSQGDAPACVGPAGDGADVEISRGQAGIPYRQGLGGGIKGGGRIIAQGAPVDDVGQQQAGAVERQFLDIGNRVIAFGANGVGSCAGLENRNADDRRTVEVIGAVVAAAAIEGVITLIAPQAIGAAATADRIVTGRSVDFVVAAASADGVVAV